MENNLRKIYSDEKNVVYDARNTPFSIFGNEADESKYMLDATVIYGKDYPSGYVDYDMYRILNRINGSESDFDSLMSDFVMESSFSEVQIKNILLDNDFIKPVDSDVEINVKEEVLKLNPSQLSKLLKKHGIIASGKKKKLIKLAVQNLPESEFINVFGITSEGLKFLEDFRWITLFHVALNDFEFNEFYRYIDEHEGDYMQLALDFTSEHLDNAIKQRDFAYYDICLGAKADIYAFERYDLKTAFHEEIRRMILRLNPIMYTYSSYYTNYLIFNPDNIQAIRLYADELGIDDIKGVFFSIWDSMDLEREYVTKEVAYEYLERLFDDEDYDMLSNEFDVKYFESCEEYFNIAMDHYSNNEYRLATDYFIFTLEMEPEHSEALYGLAASYYYLKDYESAMEIIDEATETNPDDGRFLSVKAKCYSDLGRKDDAEECYNKAIELKPGDAEILTDAGDFYLDDNEFEKALDYFTRASLIDKDDFYPILHKAKVFVEMEKWDEADKCFEDIHNITGDSLDYFVQKGGYLLRKEDYEDAIECFDKALEFDSHQPFLWMSKAIAYNDLDDEQHFHECVDKANMLDPLIVPAFLNFLDE